MATTTIRLIDGQQFTHVRHSHIASGTSKKSKLAEWSRMIVSRLVEVPNPGEFKNRYQLFSETVALLEDLRGTPGICHHLAHGVFERVKNRRYPGEMKIESYDVLYENGDLLNFLDTHLNIDNATIVRWTENLLQSLSEIHKKGIYHLDIKPQNILIGAELEIALCDFEFGWKKGYPSRLNCGTPMCCPPEGLPIFRRYNDTIPMDEEGLKEYQSHLEKRDVWSMGLVLYMLYYKKPLHQIGLPSKDQINRLSFIQNPPNHPILDIIWLMLRPDPKDRITSQSAYEMMNNALNENQEPLTMQAFKQI